jgi:hypothetical protein
MRRSINVGLAALLFSGWLLASAQVSKNEGLRCTLTNTKIEKCCCERREGKLYCALTKKAIEKCCCEPVGGASGKKTG